jgi:hypothetical protein
MLYIPLEWTPGDPHDTDQPDTDQSNRGQHSPGHLAVEKLCAETGYDEPEKVATEEATTSAPEEAATEEATTPAPAEAVTEENTPEKAKTQTEEETTEDESAEGETPPAPEEATPEVKTPEEATPEGVSAAEKKLQAPAKAAPASAPAAPAVPAGPAEKQATGASTAGAKKSSASAKAAPARKSVRVTTSEEPKWECKYCTMGNKPKDMVCDMCNRVRFHIQIPVYDGTSASTSTTTPVDWGFPLGRCRDAYGGHLIKLMEHSPNKIPAGNNSITIAPA